MKDKVIIIICLVIHVIGVVGVFYLAPDSSVRSYYIRILDAVLCFLITLEVYRIKKDVDEHHWVNHFPYMLFIISGTFLFGFSLFSFPDEYFPIVIYPVSLAITIYGAVKSKRKVVGKIAPLCSLILLTGSIVYLLCFDYPIFVPEVKVSEGLVFSIKHLYLGWWLLLLGFHFSLAVIEETIFRLFLLSMFKEMKLNDKVALIFGAIIFSLAHLGRGNLSILFSTFLMGIFYGLSYKKCNSLVPLIISHTVYNILVDVLTAYSVSFP